MTAAAADYGTAELRAGPTRVVIAPTLGGKIITMEIGGRQWLWGDPKVPHSASNAAESGGFDELFPTAAACNLPAITGRYSALHLPNAYSGLSLPDRGELGSQSPEFSLETRDDGVYATCGWVSDRMPYRFVRALYASSSGHVVMRYGVHNDGLDRMPFLWMAQPSFALTKHTRIELADGARTRLWRQHGIELGSIGTEARWPRIAAAGKLRDLSQPDALGRRFACKLFVDAPQGKAAIIEQDARLDVTWDASFAPFVALWFNKKGFAAGSRRRPPLNFALGPSSGAPDSLAEAIGTWKSASWLEPGETREWTVTWSASPS